LEEPPAYAKFILATTEKHKIIPTILSRCQIYDFKRIGISDIAKHLAYIAQQESIEVEEDALHIIAQKADGALRDALSLFDQIVSFSGNKISYLNVIENLNVLDYEYYFRLVDSILQKNIAQTLLIINEIIDNGFDGYHFIGGFGSHLRNILVSKDATTIELLEVGKSVKQRYLEQASQAPTSFLLKALEINNTFDLNYKSSNNKTLHLELDLLQMVSLVGVPVEPKPTVQIPSKEEAIATPTVKPSRQKAETKVEIVKTEVVKPTNIITQEDTDKNPNLPKEVKYTDKKEETVVEEKQDITSNKIRAEKTSTETSTKKTRTQIPDVLSMGFKKPTKEIVKKTESLIVKDANVNQELIQENIKIFAEEHKHNDMLFTALSAYPIQLQNNKILLKVDNKFLANQIFQNKQTILEFLERKLSNNILLIDTTIIEEVGKVDKRAYSEADKLKELTKLNPELDNFMGQLKLKLDE
jgi:DNA polymerase-3 subunit gamma/tau